MKPFVPRGDAGAKTDNDSASSDDQGSGGSASCNPSVNFRGQRRRNDTHASTIDSQARLFRKGRGQPAKLCYRGHALMDNRHGLIVDTRLTPATGYAERDAATAMIREIPGTKWVTLAADAGYNTQDFGPPSGTRRHSPCR